MVPSSAPHGHAARGVICYEHVCYLSEALKVRGQQGGVNNVSVSLVTSEVSRVSAPQLLFHLELWLILVSMFVLGQK